MPFISSRRFAASLPAAPFVIISRHRVTRVAETLHTPHSHQMTLPVMTRLVERANGPVCVQRVRNNRLLRFQPKTRPNLATVVAAPRSESDFINVLPLFLLLPFFFLDITVSLKS